MDVRLELMKPDRFPRSAGYDVSWMIENSMGPNVLWLSEFLSEVMAFKPGMKVLDLGCGKALSSVFFAREFGVEVWATDLWIAAEENERRIQEAGLAGQIHTIHAEAHALPYEQDFFDAIVSLDAYHYFGTDDLYLGYITKFLKRGRQIGVVSPGLVREFEGDPPEHLQSGWYWDFASLHSPAWWRRHWDRVGKVNVEVADWLEDGWKHWALWGRVCDEQQGVDGAEAAYVEADAGRNLGFARIVANRRETDRWL